MGLGAIGRTSFGVIIGYALVLFTIGAVLAVIGAMYGTIDTLFDLGIGFRDFMDMVFGAVLLFFFAPLLVGVLILSILVPILGPVIYDLINILFVDILEFGTTRLTWTTVDSSAWVTDSINILNSFKSFLLSTG